METEQLQKFILAELNNLGSIQDSRKLFYTPISRHLDQPNDSLVLQSSLQGLQSKEMIDYKNHETYTYTLSDEALDLIKNGSHEARVWACLSTDEGLDPKEIITKVGSTSAKVGQGRAFKQNWIKKVDNKFFKNVLDIEDVTVNNLVYIQAHNTLNDEKELSDLKKRKLIKPKKLLHFSIAKGPQYSPELITFETDLTSDMLIDGSWKNKSFKKYNFDAAGALPQGGALHPLLKVREEFRNIFFEMGFEEMPTNQFVESCFWNFDSLFVPQQHVARELQDTFYIKEPKVADVSDKEYYNKVKTTHESGGFGSIGYRAPFSEDETKRLVLRTHTTATSAQYRVFRNEAVDATHLAEFHQVEGVIADKNITLGDLIGFMEVFFKKMGMSQLRFKPAYNPYTEPSLEIFAHHDGLAQARGGAQSNPGADNPTADNVFAMPQSGTTVSVESVDHVFQTKMLSMLKQTGRSEMVVGWYHSHPGFGCWLSSVDINTQQSFEQLNPRAVAIVVDPIQSVKGKVVADAFRLIDAQNALMGQESRQSTSNVGQLIKPSIQGLIHGVGRHYYSLAIQYRKSKAEERMLSSLSGKAWTKGLEVEKADEFRHKNENAVEKFSNLADQYGKSVAEELTLTPEQLSTRHVGKQDPKRHLEEHVNTSLESSTVQMLESEWNKKNLFTGWVDVKLTEKGEQEAKLGGERLKASNTQFDCAYTSSLQRAQKTLEIIQSEIGQTSIPVTKDEALNERHYGELQGLNKDDARNKWGEDQVHIWRRSYNVPPPGDNAESLELTAKRVLPYWKSEILPKLADGKNILIAAHGNSLRALIMDIEKLSGDQVVGLELATGVPIEFKLDIVDGEPKVTSKKIFNQSL
ncbi:hypothetical protein E3P77_01629 [Wallemia ichthyophaga]|nr:hypothetical protein E3P97_02115 [Wallemia ichthyophaga]TIB04640.1 hypothetical protein E3P96_01582 [Wallemia ichthyophaga]TIB32722.1 hypothetical protein E3P85_01664 [Wallemia ichthyophaga]TIB46557.1 hypothetical protein E3P82_02113 [Wallemia ichthyophaga]TIB50506.1 hypothetical protein E3P81_02116 [Wallemia ichthyophaga]